LIKGKSEFDGKHFEEFFKGGQDFEFVKYKIAGLLNIDTEGIVNIV